METTTHFDLNQSIRMWRDTLAQSATMRTEELDELEHHLRDSIVQLRERQLTEEESFFIAARRLGGGEVLACEFAKVNPVRVWQSRLCWMLAGVFLVTVIGNLSNVGSALLWRLAPQEINGHWLGFFAVAIRWAGLVAPLAGFLWLTTRRPEFVARWKARCVRYPARTAIGLIFMAILLFAISSLPSLFLAMRFGIPPQAMMLRLQTVNYWQVIGFNTLEMVLLPIALVWLARRAQVPRLAK
jgi:hypothetical protein